MVVELCRIMMFLKSVSCLICICYLTSVAAAGSLPPDEVSVRLMEKLVRSTNLKLLLAVQVKNGNQQMSLTNVLGPEPNQWRVDQANFETVSTVVLTVLRCAYSKKMYDFIEGGRLLIEKCADLGKEDNENFKTSRMTKFHQCLSDVKMHLNSFRELVLDLLTSIFHYQKKSNMSADKSFLSMLLSIHLYLHNDTSYTEPNGEPSNHQQPPTSNAIALIIHTLYNKCEQHGGQKRSPVDSVIDKLIRTHIYIINQVEAYIIERCYPFSFDATEFRTSLWVSSIGSVRKSHLSKVNNMGKLLEGYAAREMDFLGQLNFVDPRNNRDMFNLNTMMLYNLFDIELVSGHKTSALRFMKIPWNLVTIPLEEVYSYVLTDYHSDQIVKYQVLVMETIVSTVLFLVTNILNRSAERANGSPLGKDDPVLKTIISSLDTLETFGFPGHIAIALDGMKRTLDHPVFMKHILYSTNKYFSSVSVDEKCISELIRTRETTEHSEQQLTDILINFTEGINRIRPDINMLNEMNKYLCDYEYEYENIGFLQAKPNERHLSKRNVAYISFNCAGASILIKHLIFSNYLIDQCQKIETKNNQQTSGNINMCFTEVKRFIGGLIGKAVMLFLEAIIDFYTTVLLIIPSNRKLIESIYAFVLYIDNESFVVEANNLHEKIDEIKRSHLFIINIIEQFTIDYCSGLNSKQLRKKVCEDQIHTACAKLVNDSMKMVKCIGKIMSENALKTSPIINNLYNNVRFKRKSKDKFSLELLLLDIVIKKSTLPDNGFSSINKIRTTWEGTSKSLIELRNTVKRRLNPKYLLRYQLLMIKMVAFIAYERMKDIIVKIKLSDTKTVDESYMFLIKRSVSVSCPSFPSSINNLFSAVFTLFHNFLKDINSYNNGDKVIEAIEFEQRKLELYMETSDGPIEIQSSDERLGTDYGLTETGNVANKSGEPENIPPKSKINETVLNSINRFVKYLGDVLEVKTELNHVINIIDWKKVRNASMI